MGRRRELPDATTFFNGADDACSEAAMAGCRRPSPFMGPGGRARQRKKKARHVDSNSGASLRGGSDRACGDRNALRRVLRDLHESVDGFTNSVPSTTNPDLGVN